MRCLKLLMAAGLILAVSGAAGATTVVMISDGFEGGTVGSPPPGWVEWYPGNGDVHVTDTQARSGSKSVFLSDTSTTGYIELGKLGSAAPGFPYYIAEASVRPAQTDQGFGGLTLFENPAPNGFVGQIIFGSDGKVWWSDDTGDHSTGIAYSADVWYDLKIVANNSTQKWDFYVDDALLGSSLNYLRPVVDHPRVVFTASGVTGVAEWYLDDVRLTAVPEPLTMLGVFMGVTGLAGYVRKRMSI